ncbi:MAG TPA: iron ABC transporter permease [Candidatus Desulfaltia sp.]|nr:iron ABC transporter permease [Candidatus Desulfaltia sp.]
MIGQASKRGKAWRVFFLALPLLLFLISLSIGSYAISPGGLYKTVISLFSPSSHPEVPDAYRDILLRIRLPRLLLAVAIGAALSVSGASLQALFKNPLVNEYILGISSGAAFGAALSLVFLGRAFPPQIGAFVFAFVAVGVVLLISGQAESHFISLLLTGIIVTAFFSALLSLVEFFASPYVLQALFFWLMGSLSLASWKDLAISLPLIAVGLILLFLLRWRLNVLSMSDEEARSLGVNVRREKMLVIAATTLITAAGTSIVGIIGWVGFIVPHFVRLMFGADNRLVIPMSAAMGASIMLVADDIIRGVSALEIPIGIFTSLVGIPIFLALLKKTKKVWL